MSKRRKASKNNEILLQGVCGFQCSRLNASLDARLFNTHRDALIQRSSTIDKKERSSVVQFSRKCILSALPSWQRGETGNFLSWVNLKTFIIDFLFLFFFPFQNPGIQFLISRPVPGKRIGTGNASILYSFAHFLCEIDPLYYILPVSRHS